MYKNARKGLWLRILLALVTAGALVQLSVVPVAAQTQPNVPLPGNVVPAVARGSLTATGTADASQQVTLVIGLKLPNPAGLQAAAASVHSGRQAPLTAQQFVDRYAPTTADYQSVVSWLSAQGFAVQTSPNRLVVTARGSLGQAAKAFGVTVKDYNLSGRTYYANDTAPQVPANLGNIVESVAGLDDLPTFHGTAVAAPPGGKAVAAASIYYGSNGFTPLGIQKAYDLTPILGTTAGQVYGTGQTVDIVIWNSLQQSDVDTFDNTYGLPPIIPDQIAVDGPVSTDFNDGSMEATLDVETVHSLAPGAAIDVFEAPNSNFAPLEEALNEAVVQHNANVLNMSWGADEGTMLDSGYINTMDAIFAQGAAEGMTLLASSGDSGKYQYNEATSSYETAVSYPASDPYVTAAGGTDLTPAADGSYGGETAWNATEGLGYAGLPYNPPAYCGSGGGFSTVFDAPSWQQATVDGYTYGGKDYNTTNARGVPDVAFNAGGLNAAYINGTWESMIGTSISSPSWAAFIALVDQAYTSAHQPSLGYFNPVLYNLCQNDPAEYQSVFHQVYIGDNDTESSGDSPYYAALGWNPVTGWGTPDFQLLFNYLTSLPAASYPPSITASPTALPPDYPGTPTITVTGTNTHFSQSDTTVSFVYDTNNLASNVIVQSATHLTFTLAASQDLLGEGTMTVHDPTDGYMTATLDLGAETASISPDTLTEGYGSQTITITGDYSYYDDAYGGVTVQVVHAADQTPALYLGGPKTPGMPATLTGSGPPYPTATFTLPAGLAAGQYDVVVNDNDTGVSMSVPLTVVSAPTFISAATNTGGGTVTVTFSKTMAAPPAAPAGFSVTVGGNNDTVTAVALHTSDSTKYDLTLTTPVQCGQTATLSYTPGSVCSADGGALAAFSGLAVTNNVPATGGGGGGGGGGGTPSTQAVNSTTGSASVPPSAGGTVGLGTDATVTIPAGALQGTTNVPVTIQTSGSPPTVPSGLTFLGQTYQFSVNGQDHYTFNKDVTLTFTFDPSKIPADEAPAVYYYDDTTAQWVCIGGTVNWANDTVTVTVNHFTEYAVMTKAKVPAPPLEKFHDIAGTWAQASIDKLLSVGAITGYPDGTFRPNNDITRAEFVTVLVKALKLAPKNGPVFADTAGNWAATYISTAAAYGIVNGYDASHFGPNDPVTREQLTAMVVRAAKLTPVSGQLAFKDAAQIDAWAREYVETAVKNGLVHGYPDGTFRPHGYATRAEAVTVIAGLLK